MSHSPACHRLDRAGACASLLCAVHCALLPLVLAVAPSLLGLGFLASEGVEWALFAASATIGATSIHYGRRKHGRRSALYVLGAGLFLLALGRVGHERGWGAWGPAALVAGGVIVASAHWTNARLCASCPKCG